MAPADAPEGVERPGVPLDAAIPHRRSRRMLFALAVLFLLSAGLVWAASTLALTTNAAKRDLVAQLSALTVHPVTVDGAVELSLLPHARLSVSSVRMETGARGEGAPVLAVGRILADLDMADALFGRMDLTRLVFVRPQYRAAPERDGSADAPDGGLRDGAGDLQPAVALAGLVVDRFEDLQTVEVREGVFRASSPSRSLGISNANLALTRLGRTGPVAVEGSYVWNGQFTSINLRVSAPEAFFAGRSSDLDLEMVSPSLSASFGGSGSWRELLHLEGRLDVSTPSIARAAEWLGDPGARLPEIGPLAVSADVSLNGRRLNFQDADVTIAGNSGRGAIEFVGGTRPSLGGSLAFAGLNVDSFARAIAPLPDDPFDFERRLDMAFIDLLDLDIRVSAASASIAAVPIADLAATIKFAGGVATADIGDATLFGGRGQARLAIDARAPRPTIKGTVSLANIEPARLIAAAGLATVGLSGRADMHARIAAPAFNWASLLQDYAMTAELSGRNGRISGLDREVFLAEGTRPFALGATGSAIDFDRMSAEISAAGPRVRLDELTLAGPEGTLRAAGNIQTARSKVDIRGVFEPAPAVSAGGASAFTTSKPTRFKMQGEWPRPSVTAEPALPH